MVRTQASGEPADQPSLISLKKRADFLRVRGGARCATKAFVLEARARGGTLQDERPRFGFTVTKRLGNAVGRNRIKRRLKAAARGVYHQHAHPAFDYVIIARSPALDLEFAKLVADLGKALKRVHRTPRDRQTDAKPTIEVS